jgi:hypothetical protein
MVFIVILLNLLFLDPKAFFTFSAFIEIRNFSKNRFGKVYKALCPTLSHVAVATNGIFEAEDHISKHDMPQDRGSGCRVVCFVSANQGHSTRTNRLNR